MKLFLGLAAAVALTSCAAMEKDFQERTCHYDGAYQQGVNDAQENKNMNAEAIAYQCPEATKADVRKGYREGFMGIKSSSQAINLSFGGLAEAPKCIEAYGRKECGYGCVEAYGQLRCAKYPANACKEAYGKITCGKNCRDEYGQIKCDSYE